MFHLADGMSTFAVIMVGGTHVFILRFEPAELLTEIARNRVTHAVLVPTMINAVVNFPGLAGHDVSSLQVVAHGASPMQDAVRRKATAAFPGVRFLHVYGMTEAAPLVTAMDLGIEPTGERVRSCGRPALLMDVRIADADDREVPRDTVGEVQVRGPNIMLGYWNQPEASRTVLYQLGKNIDPSGPCWNCWDPDWASTAGMGQSHPELVLYQPAERLTHVETDGPLEGYGLTAYSVCRFQSGLVLRGGWYHTGDGGVMNADGYVYIVDRLKDMIITGGENVYSARFSVTCCFGNSTRPSRGGAWKLPQLEPQQGHPPDRFVQ